MSATSEEPRSAAVAAHGAARPADREVTGRHPAGGGGRSPEPSDYRAAFNVAQLAMAVLDREGTVLSANAALADLLGAAGAGLPGQAAADLVDLASDARTWHAYREVLRGTRRALRCTRRIKHPGGQAVWAEVTVAPVPAMDGGALLAITDISDRRELQARLRHLQMHDPVTRLPNRALFFERLTTALERSGPAHRPVPDADGATAPASAAGARYEAGTAGTTDAGNGAGNEAAAAGGAAATPDESGRPARSVRAEQAEQADASKAREVREVRGDRDAEDPAERGTGRIGLLYLDLDGFKAVNDTLGHRTGDRLLAAVAQRLVDCAEHADRAGGGHLVARLGGDEFALLVEDSTGTEQLTRLARSVLDSLQLPFDLSGQRLALSASIGVVERVCEATTPTGLMQAADTTLYWAKADGKARWTLFDPERNAHRMTRQTLSSSLRPAVERGEFQLEYQPLVCMADSSVKGVEALVRWQHPQLGTLTPNRFIGLAEEDGSIVQLGSWVLRTACRQARRWQLAHPSAPLFVSVNVAVRQVWDSDLVAEVADVLAETGLRPELLQLELTESAVMGSAGRPLQALQALSEMGVGIAIDDFGTGYSNLAYLSRLPVSALKLDGSFVRGFRYDEGGAHHNPADEMIVEALVQLAHRLGLTVTAECVETSVQAERLRRIGCDTGQGWLYSRPVAPERISDLLARRSAGADGADPGTGTGTDA